ncbi:MAG: right-handed parallel beta-helix repeat-containing protein [Candidatus Heimdallarchaeota archaeon]|nr:MAG: right-handed parallel beta-helix repeat-containing protein [Candidatus Heimdallarchaeota archaeon]
MRESFKKSNNLNIRPFCPRKASKTIHSSLGFVQYETHERIIIYGIDHFREIAVMEDWPGDGTSSNTFIIEGYNITDSYGDLIVIHDTNVYFIIRDNYLNGLTETWGGILFYNVINGIVDENIVENIDILGIGAYFSGNLIISDNKVENTNLNGIRIEACPGPATLTNNTITNSVEAGIWIGDSSNKTTIRRNTIYENQYGIVFN